MKKIAMAAMMMTLAAATASAQVIVHTHGSGASDQQQLQVIVEKSPATAVHVSVEGPAVTGAPYSAEATTESVQVLADGNRIVRRTTAKVYRDGKGRTRRETLGPDGQVTSILVSDPSGGKSFMIEPGTNTHTGVATFISSEGARPKAVQAAPGTGSARAQFSAQAKHEAGVQAAQETHVVTSGAMTMAWTAAVDPHGEGAAPKKEDLGQQTIEGLTAKGTRTTIEIPAGTIGNDLPIVAVGEEWVSVDLKVLVMTRHADPRMGETTYRLTGIVRGEPDPSLFEPPAGVTVK
jgi:hypothetical protein